MQKSKRLEIGEKCFVIPDESTLNDIEPVIIEDVTRGEITDKFEGASGVIFNVALFDAEANNIVINARNVYTTEASAVENYIIELDSQIEDLQRTKKKQQSYLKEIKK